MGHDQIPNYNVKIVDSELANPLHIQPTNLVPADIAAMISAVRTANNQSADIINLQGAKGVRVFIDMTAVPTIETVTFTVEGKDEVSGKYYPLLVSIAIVAVSTVVLTVYPALTDAANVTKSDVIPRTLRIDANHSAAGNFTYSVGVALIQ